MNESEAERYISLPPIPVLPVETKLTVAEGKSLLAFAYAVYYPYLSSMFLWCFAPFSVTIMYVLLNFHYF